jgi:glycosyltransferase involved in cell wall biosynthesis
MLELEASVDVFSLESRSTKGFDLDGFNIPAIKARSFLKNLPAILRCIRFSLKHAKLLKEIVRSVLLSPRAALLAQKIAQGNYDVVHLFWSHYPAMVAHELMQITGSKKPILSVFCGAYDLTNGYGLTDWALREADLITTHCQINVAAIENRCGRKPLVLYRGVNLVPSQDRTSSELIRFVVVSRLVPGKCVDLAMDAFERISSYFPGAQLTIVGDGPERLMLERKAKRMVSSEKIKFTGFISHRDVIEVMSNSDVLLVPSENKSERLPNVIKEAMMVGCIPIASDSVGINELIDNNVDGFITSYRPSKSPGAIREIIESFIRDKSSIQQNARRKIEVRFDNKSISGSRLASWKSLMMRKKHE